MSSWTMTAVRKQTVKRQRTRQWSSVHHIKIDTCMVPQHCSKPAIRERARDSTAQRGQAENIELLLNYSYLCMKCKQCTSTASIQHVVYLEISINSTEGSVFYLRWGKEPRHTALLSIVTRNMWQFLKSDSILSMDSILKGKETQYLDVNRLVKEATALQTWDLVVYDKIIH